MITKTSEVGIQTLIYLSLRKASQPLSPRVIAEDLGVSASYLAKIMGLLVRAQILLAHRGVKGGVTLRKRPEDVRLLDIVQALQGLVIGNYCEPGAHHEEPVCAFHEAMREVHTSTLAVLSRWTLADLAARPMSKKAVGTPVPCRMECLRRFAGEAAGGATA